PKLTNSALGGRVKISLSKCSIALAPAPELGCRHMFPARRITFTAAFLAFLSCSSASQENTLPVVTAGFELITDIVPEPGTRHLIVLEKEGALKRVDPASKAQQLI